MMPEGCHNKIRSVRIYYYYHFIAGFSFLDKDMKLLWKIGSITQSSLKVETVLIADYEVIVGVKARLYGHN